jgi:hypothetical protein
VLGQAEDIVGRIGRETGDLEPEGETSQWRRLGEDL